MDGQSGSLILPTASEKITALQEDERGRQKTAELMRYFGEEFVPTFIELSGVSKNAIEQLSVEEIEELDKIVLRNKFMQMVRFSTLNPINLMTDLGGGITFATGAFITLRTMHEPSSCITGIFLMFSSCMFFTITRAHDIIGLIYYISTRKQLRSAHGADYGQKLLEAISANW